MGKYSEKDIKAIISRAAELQQITSGPESLDSAGELLTLEDVEEIAEEAGLSPEYVRQAAIEYEGVPVEEPLFLDTGNNYEVEIIGFAKGTLDKKTWAEIRSIIEYSFDNPGKVTRRPEGIEWEARPTGILKHLESKKSPHIRIESQENRSTIRLQKSLKSYNKLHIPALMFFGMALFLLSLIIAGDGDEEMWPVLIVLGAIGEMFRRWTNRKKQKERERLKEIVEKIQRILNRKAKLADRTGVHVQQPLLDQELDEIPEQEEGKREAGEETGKVRSGGE